MSSSSALRLLMLLVRCSASMAFSSARISLAKSLSLNTMSCNMISSNLWRHSSEWFAIGPPSCFKQRGAALGLPVLSNEHMGDPELSAFLSFCLGLCNFGRIKQYSRLPLVFFAGRVFRVDSPWQQAFSLVGFRLSWRGANLRDGLGRPSFLNGAQLDGPDPQQRSLFGSITRCSQVLALTPTHVAAFHFDSSGSRFPHA